MHAEIYGKNGRVLQSWSTLTPAGDPYRLGQDKLEFKTNGTHFINRVEVWWVYNSGQISEITVTFANEY